MNLIPLNFITQGEQTPLRRMMLEHALAGGGALSEYEVTGNPAVFNTNVSAPLSGFTIPFLPVQQGTGDPSPDNVRPIIGWTGLNISRTGINLWDGAVETGFYSTTTGLPVDASGYKRGKNRMIIKPGESVYVATAGLRLLYYDAEDNYISVTTGVGVKTVPTNCHYMRFYLSDSDYTGNVSINYPSTETEPLQPLGNSYPVTFPATGANLFNGQWEQGNIQQGVEQPSTSAMRSGFINVEPSTAYYGYTTRESNVFVFEYTDDGVYANKVNNLASNHVFTTGASTGKIRIVDRNSGTEAVNTGINYPSTVTSYEPFTNTVYGGTLDAVTGVLSVEWAEVDLGSLNYYTAEQGEDIAFVCDTGITFGGRDFVCNQYKTIVSPYWTSMTDNSIMAHPSANYLFRIRDDRYTDKDVFKAAMTEQGAKLVYPLAEPYEIPLSDIPVPVTLIGDNTIWTDTNGENTVKYKKKG